MDWLSADADCWLWLSSVLKLKPLLSESMHFEIFRHPISFQYWPLDGVAVIELPLRSSSLALALTFLQFERLRSSLWAALRARQLVWVLPNEFQRGVGRFAYPLWPSIHGLADLDRWIKGRPSLFRVRMKVYVYRLNAWQLPCILSTPPHRAVSIGILSQKGGSTQNKLLKAILLMSFIYTYVLLLCVKPAQEKIKGSY